MYKKRLFYCIMVSIAILIYACNNRQSVVISGTISEFHRGDTVYVTLTKNWESIRSAPDNFSIDKKGNFVLEFSVGRIPPPITFVKNGTLHARLSMHNILEYSPIVVDEMSGNAFKINVGTDGIARAEVKL